MESEIDKRETLLNGADELKKVECIESEIRALSFEEVEPLLPALKRIAFSPSEAEKQEQVDEAARECLEYLGVFFQCEQ